jgi:hypothetical protein
MDEAPERSPGDSQYLKLPWPVVAGGLFALLAVALAAGLYANRFIRPQTTIVPTTTPPPVVAVAPVATPVNPTAPPASTIPPATPPPAPTSAPPPSPSATPVPATSTPAPALTSTPSPVATVDPALAAEVGQAYERYWRVTSQALLQLDSSQLPQVMEGERLATATQLIEDLRAQGRAVHANVTLNYVVAAANGDSASVIDRYEDRSFFVIPGTDEALTKPSSDESHVLFRLRRISGVWKVVDSVREE